MSLEYIQFLGIGHFLAGSFPLATFINKYLSRLTPTPTNLHFFVGLYFVMRVVLVPVLLPCYYFAAFYSRCLQPEWQKGVLEATRDHCNVTTLMSNDLCFVCVRINIIMTYSALVSIYYFYCYQWKPLV